MNNSGYLTGWTHSVDFPEAGNALRGNKDVFVASFDPTGQLVYATYLGGTKEDQGLGMATDGDGNAYVTGVTKSKDFPTLLPHDATLGGSQDAFVAKLSPSGQLLYATYLGGQNSEQGAALAVDSTGQATVTGWTQSKDFPLRNAHDTVLGGSRDAFVAQLTPSGQLGYATYLGGNHLDQGTGVALDGAGQIAVTGWTQSKDFPTVNPFDATLGGRRDAFVSRFTEAGQISYATYLGGSKTEQGAAIAADPAGHLYVAGLTQSPDLPLPDDPEDDPTATAAALSGKQDAFVARLDPDGQLGFAVYLGGSKSDQATGLAADSWGNLYVSGWTQSKDLPTVNPTDARLGGSQDAFVAQFETDGNLVFATYLGGSKADQATAVATDGWGRVYVTGSTASRDFPTPAPAGATPQDTTLGGAQDAFLAVYQGDLEVPVPDVVGLTQTAAKDQLTARRLTVGPVTEAYSDTVPEDHVISQDPVADILVAVGATVNLVVSLGPELVTVTVPDVVGQLQADAETAIRTAPLMVGTITQAYSDTVAVDHVISQNPAASMVVPKGTAVNLEVSLGQELVTVPNVVGQTQEAVQTALVNAHLTVGTVTQQTSATVPAGQVISQTPMADAKVAKGTAVNLVVSSGSSTLPPDPGTVAPPLDPTVTTTLADATKFLYTGANPIQTGVAPGTIEERRAAVIRGKVFDRVNNPLPGVTVTVLDHPELGQTLSRADGAFDLAVNGGGVLTLVYRKAGYLEAQRQVQAPWQDYAFAPDVSLAVVDPVATTLDLTAPEPIQIARGSESTDADGTRQATLLFPAGTTAEMVLPDGSTQPLTTLTLRATEYTVGPDGPKAMPAELPPTTGYTYAVEITADEAIAAGATTVNLSQPIPFYVENFLGFPTGETVPVGYYDRGKGQWIAAPNGRVIKVVGITAGAADLDTDGDGNADPEAALAALGITGAERAKLAGLYTAGQSLWRVPLEHFTPWDCNWPFGPPEDAQGPPTDSPEAGDQDQPDPEDSTTCPGCVIQPERASLGEDIALVGLPFGLHYCSDRMPGRTANYKVVIPLSGTEVPPSLEGIDLTIEIAGRRIEQSFPPEADQSITWTWDGLDAYGREVVGSETASIRVSYRYPLYYYSASADFYASFAQFADPGMEVIGQRGSQVSIDRTWEVALRAGVPQAVGLGGWTLGVHHAYAPQRGFFGGDGSEYSAQAQVSAVIETVAGNGSSGYSGDGGPGTSAQLSPSGVAIGADGSLFIADSGHHRIRRVGPDGLITTVAGNGSPGYSGDGGPANGAQLFHPYGVAIGADGSLFIADYSNNRIRRVGPDGLITTVAGNGSYGYGGDGGPATSAPLYSPSGVAIGADGSLFIADTNNNRIRRVGPDRLITTIAGNGTGGYNWVEDVPATSAQLYSPSGVAIGADGSLFIADSGHHRIRRVGPDGIITTVAGSTPVGGSSSGDGGPATSAVLFYPFGVAIGADGSLFIADTNNNRIRRVGPDGIITTVAGNGSEGYSGDGGPATSAGLNYPSGVAIGADGSLFIADSSNYRIRRVRPPLPGFSLGDSYLPSQDATEIYHFDATGRHLRTLDALTGTALYQFAYTDAGLLNTITDRDGRVTLIERAADGTPEAILAPDGQRTALTLDPNGYLETVTDPAGNLHRMGYGAGGLMTSYRDPNQHENVFTYDDVGHFKTDTDPAGGGWTLTRTDLPVGYSVAMSSGEARTARFAVESLTTGDRRQTNTAADGTVQTVLFGTNGTETTTFPDGTQDLLQEGPDPRFGMLAPIPASRTTTTPGGHTRTATTSRQAQLADPANPLSLVALDETTTVNGRTSTSVYDAATRTSTSTSAAGRQSMTLIDALGRPERAESPGLAPVAFTYDARGRLATLTQGSGADARAVTLSYDAAGNLASVTDPLGRSAGFAYDLGGRVTRQTFPDGRQVLFDYDAKGNLTSLAPPGRPAHTFNYTPVDLTAEYVPPDVGAGTNSTRYSYNRDKQLTQVLRPDGVAVDLTYDSAGRLASLAIPEGAYAYGYNAASGNLSQIAAPGGTALDFSYDGSLLTGAASTGAVAGSVGFAYDNDFRVSSVAVNGGDPVAYQYDVDSLLIGAGDLTLTRDAQNGLLTGSGLGVVTDSWGYNGFAEPASYSAVQNGSPLLEVAYTRDKLGRIVEKTETVGGTSVTYAYGYDLAGRLVEVRKGGVVQTTWGYDANGNCTHVNGVEIAHYDAQDHLLDYAGATYTYTANGELKTKTVGPQVTTYSYDALGNLRQVSLPDGTVIDYLTDGRNRRIGKKVNGTLVQGFLYQNQLKPVAELDGAGNVVSRFVYATHANVPDYLVKGGVTYRIITDHLGSPRLVVNTATGAVVQRMDYDAWGNVLLDNNPGFQPFGFAGGLYDRDTKLVRFGARDYDAGLGRWISKDPISFWEHSQKVGLSSRWQNGEKG